MACISGNWAIWNRMEDMPSPDKIIWLLIFHTGGKQQKICLSPACTLSSSSVSLPCLYFSSVSRWMWLRAMAGLRAALSSLNYLYRKQTLGVDLGGLTVLIRYARKPGRYDFLPVWKEEIPASENMRGGERVLLSGLPPSFLAQHIIGTWCSCISQSGWLFGWYWRTSS